MKYLKAKLQWVLRTLILKCVPELKRELISVNFNEISTRSDRYPAKVLAPYQIGSSDIGEFTYVASGSRISNTKIGKFCSIGPNFTSGYGVHPVHGISTSPMFYSTAKQNGITLAEKSDFVETKQVNIGCDVWIGMNVSVLDGVSIGDGAIIGAGAVVTKDVPSYAIACGVPARVKKMRFTDAEIEKFKEINWYEWDVVKLQSVADSMFDKKRFFSENML
jgi:acetyltransferase-like isoleucine patch superfamily enzyme